VNFLKIGFIKKTHGLKGELKVFPLTDNSKRFNKLKKIFLLISDKYEEKEIDYVRVLNEEILLKLSNYNSLSEVEPLKNVYIFIERKDGEKLKEWEFYSQDLVDCEVFFNDQRIGKVIDLINYGANDNLVIKNNNEEFYFPFLRKYIDKIDLDNKIIIVNELEGFL